MRNTFLALLLVAFLPATLFTAGCADRVDVNAGTPDQGKPIQRAYNPPPEKAYSPPDPVDLPNQRGDTSPRPIKG